MKALTRTLKTMLDALAHEDAGEFLTPRQKAAVLGQTSNASSTQTVAPVVPEAAPASRRRVALFTGSELPIDVIDYVTQTCSRLQHDLTVLTFESESTMQALIEPHRERMEASGIDIRLVSLAGNTISQLTRYLGNHPEIAFLACKESGYLGRSYLTGNQQKNAIPVPVVVIVERKKAAGLKDANTGKTDASAQIA